MLLNYSKSLIIKNLLVFGSTHALIDAACAAIIFANLQNANLDPGNYFSMIVLYNILAFGLQAPFGDLTDKYRNPILTSVIGCILIAFSAIIFKHLSIAIIFAGIGNALFHVGGGIISLNMNNQKATIPGIYVAPGALGLFIGGLIGKTGHYTAWPFVILIALAVMFILLVEHPKIDYNTKNKADFNYFELILILLLVSIAIRSLIGLAVNFPWKSNITLLVTLTLAVTLGKAFGGYLADKFGWIRTTVLGLLISAPLISLGYNYPVFSITGILLFNLTMPVTLTAVANMFPARPGFAFGLTTLALIVGALPTFTEYNYIVFCKSVILVTIMLSAIILYIGLKKYFNNINKNIIAND